ncbi:hypothetical protein [Reichenbachiella versicolor]|uniref:hypothetical protein n=1 Tax=Reichenbachiella versicolor TaxID=1821036 RepID=UPI000D6E52C3|nr:hypothetical protein [Reichenbachiella versicolor]
MNILAWYKKPEPNGENVLEKQLLEESEVIRLFSQCRTKNAIILPEGWKFLFDEFGLEGLLKIDNVAHWKKNEDVGEWICNLVYQAFISGFNPLLNEFGDYDEADHLFLLDDGQKVKIDWKEIATLKDSVDV